MNLIDLLNKSGLLQFEGITRQQIEEYQYDLYAAGLANIPLSYTVLLESTNGVQTDTLSLFGIGLPHSIVRDIRGANSVGEPQNKKIFLGDNFLEYLIYDWTEKAYIIIKKDNPSDRKIFNLLEEGLPYFLREYLKV